MAGRFSIEAIFRAVDQVTRPVNKMQRSVGKFTNRAEAGLRRMDRMAGKMSGALVTAGTRIGTALAGGGAALGTTVTMLNSANTQSQILAESLGTTSKRMETMTGALAGSGFEMEHLSSMFEEMNNKIGESRGLEEMSRPAQEALDILNIEFDRLRQMSPEDQFETITNAALQMEDAQKAAAAADILMGGEASRMVGVLRQQGGSMDEIMAKFQGLNARTDEGRAGAREYTTALNEARFMVTSLAQEIAGLASKHLTPLIERFTEFTRANKELIATRTIEWLEWVVDNFEEIVTWAGRIGATLAIWFAFHAVIKTLVTAMTLLNLVMAANPIFLVVAAVVASIAAIGTLVAWILKATGVADSWGEAFKMVVDGVVSALSWLGGMWQSFVGGLITVWQELGSAMMATITGVVNLISGTLGALIALLTGDWDAFAEYWVELWEGIKSVVSSVLDFLSPLIEQITDQIDTIKEIAGSVASFFGFGDDEDEDGGDQRQRGGRRGPEVSSPNERIAREIEERRTTDESTVTIRDETGRAEDTTDRRRGRGVLVQRTGDT